MRRPVARAIDYIERNLANELQLAAVADSVRMSEFYFSRMFRAVVGISVMSYVQRRRLAEAAKKLQLKNSRLIDIALDYQFGSHEAFTRAFKKEFGITPSGFQALEKPLRLNHLDTFDEAAFDHVSQNISPVPTFVDVPKFFVEGLSKSFDDENKHEIPLLWSQFMSTIENEGIQLSNVLWGISLPDNTMLASFKYWAAMEFNGKKASSETLQTRAFGGKRYAMFEHKCDGSSLHEKMQSSLRYIWGTWLPSSNFDYDGSPEFELYGPRFNPETMTGIIEIYVPVKSYSL